MGDIVAFLLARIAEDEKSAREIADSHARMDQAPEDFGKFVIDPIIGGYGGQTRNRNVATGLHLARFGDPSRVLAECAAKRAIVELHPLTPHAHIGGAVGCKRCGTWQSMGMGYNSEELVATKGPCDTLRILAAVYADHPDFLPEYRI